MTARTPRTRKSRSLQSLVSFMSLSLKLFSRSASPKRQGGDDMRKALLALALGAGVVSLVRAAEPPPEIPVIGETIDVRVVNVEVVATSEGRLVRGLTAGDFRLLVDGQEVPIGYFTEVADGATAATVTQGGPSSPLPPAETVGRSYLVFV